MTHLFFIGILLGLGAAIPIGAINLEIIRRNLRFGTFAGFGLGFGACCADVTYLVLLSVGMLQILNYPMVLKVTGILGSFILAWFGYQALRQKPQHMSDSANLHEKRKPFSRHFVEGYLLTLINPYTILFWSSISTTIVAFSATNPHAAIYAGIGVLLGAASWVCALNLFLHMTRHKISSRIVHKMNICGGLVLIGFAVYGFVHALSN